MQRCEGAQFLVELRSDLPPAAVIRRVLDLRGHSRVIPFTTVAPALAADQLEAGTRFSARTALGPLGFDDPMRVEAISLGEGTQTASARIVKEGRVIRGSILLLVTAEPGGAHVSWRQEVRLPWLPGLLQRPAALVIGLGYRRVIRRLLQTGPN